MKIILYCSMIYFINVYATCSKRIDCKQTDYAFEAFYKAVPDNDRIRVGDTIWFELSSSLQLKELSTNTIIDYSNAENLETAISFLELVKGENDPAPIFSANRFDNILLMM